MATTKSGKQSRSRSSSSGRTPGRSERSARGESSAKTRPEGSSRRGSRAVAGSGSKASSSSRSGGSMRAGSRSQGGRGAGAQTTTDHEFIRRWAEARRAKPSCVLGTGGRGDAGVLRLDFPGYSGRGKLQPISWDQWFEKFDEQNLALLYQEKSKDGKKSNFNKLVSREQ